MTKALEFLHMDLVVYILLAAVIAQGAVIFAQAGRLRRAARDLRQKEQELQEARRQDALGTLAGGIAHDFNNILGSIIGFGALLQEDLLTQPGLREMAHQITIAAKRGQSIVLQLMSYSKKGRREARKGQAPVSLDAVVRENVALLQPSIRRSTRITYENRAENDTVVADATQLGQAIVNLCINADHAIGVRAGVIALTLDGVSVSDEFSEAEGVRVVASGDGPVILRNGKIDPGAYLRLSVTDNGEGMTREVAQRIFDPFFTTKDVNVGTGLGLAAIQGIVRDHGGAIAVKTERFKGTTFELMFPAGTAPQALSGPPAERASQ